MKRKAVAILIALACLLMGCGDRAPKQYDDRMKYAGKGFDYAVLIDRETGVCYLKTSYGGLAVMVNQDGTPYVANGWRDNDG